MYKYLPLLIFHLFIFNLWRADLEDNIVQLGRRRVDTLGYIGVSVQFD